MYFNNAPHINENIIYKDQQMTSSFYLGFSAYGGVVEVRINRKSTRDVPNFGFVVFDNAESVQQVLGARVCTSKITSLCLYPLWGVEGVMCVSFL